MAQSIVRSVFVDDAEADRRARLHPQVRQVTADLIDLLTHRVDVRKFGAKGDGETDDTDAINAAFQAYRDDLNQLTETDPGYVISFPRDYYSGVYRTTGPINATGIRNRTWGIEGPGKLLLDFNGGVGLDLVFSRFCRINQLLIGTGTGKTPDVGVFLGRRSGGEVADDMHLLDLHVRGSFAISCLHNYGSEDMTGMNASLLNDIDSATAYCITEDGKNALGVTSTFQTVSTNTGVSFNACVWFESNWRRTHANGGNVIYKNRWDGHRYYGCYGATANGSMFVLDTTSPSVSRDLDVDMHCETTGLDTIFTFTGDATQTIEGLRYRDYDCFAASEVFKHGSGVTGVTINDLHLAINGFTGGPSNKLFSDTTKFALGRGGSCYLNDDTYFNEPSGASWDVTTNSRCVKRTKGVTVANLPSGAGAGSIAFATNGRKNGEGAGLGTGVMVFHDGTAWRACDTGATVAA